MEISPEREAAIEKRVKRRIQRRVRLLIHAGLWFLFVTLISGRLGYTGIIPVVGIVWFLIVISHAAVVAYREWIERAIRRELELERNAYYHALAETRADEYSHKAKRDPDLTLSDDSEFADEIEFDEREYRKRR